MECEHDWLDCSAQGSSKREFLCRKCGATNRQPKQLFIVLGSPELQRPPLNNWRRYDIPPDPVLPPKVQAFLDTLS